MVLATNWRDDRLLYYRYAPPPGPEDSFEERDLPEPPYEGAAPHERSVYFYWWSFLRENEDYVRCCKEGGAGPFGRLYQDFGDVRDDDFMSWWNRTRLLFCQRLERSVRIHTPDASGIFALPRGDGRIVLSLPVAADSKRVLKEIKQLIRREQDKLSDFPQEAQRDWTHARYEIATKPVLKALHIRLKLLRLRRADENVPLHKLGKDAGLEFDKDTIPEERASRVSRYIREARCLARYAAEGLFPIVKDDDIGGLSVPLRRQWTRARSG